MKRNFYTDDFEDLIREKADQYRMYPSEKVWKEINRSLHSRRKWYWSGFILLLSGISYFAINQLIAPGSVAVIAKNTKGPVAESEASSNQLPIPTFGTIPPRSSSRQRSAIAETAQQPQSEGTGLVANTTGNIVTPMYQSNPETEKSIRKLAPVFDIFTGKEIYTPAENNNWSGTTPASLMDEIAISAAVAPQSNSAVGPDEAAARLMEAEETQKFNWLQEFAVYELLAPKTKRTSLQFSFSPTINYRKLSGKNDAHMRSDVKSIPIAMNVEGNIDGLVNHKPAIGFELGSSILYAYDKNLTLKAGLQFNYSRYDIMAYSNYTTEIATIALANQFTAVSDSITNYTRIRNFGGDEKKDLKNQYFQLSVPVGLEYRIYGSGRLQFKVAGTVQPTYLMNRNSYLITTDYKNYTREPSLVRRWNVNASAEAFVSYKAAGVNWQIGPQFRYQLLSSYADQYPVKEYLMEYGIKVGVSKTIR